MTCDISLVSWLYVATDCCLVLRPSSLAAFIPQPYFPLLFYSPSPALISEPYFSLLNPPSAPISQSYFFLLNPPPSALISQPYLPLLLFHPPALISQPYLPLLLCPPPPPALISQPYLPLLLCPPPSPALNSQPYLPPLFPPPLRIHPISLLCSLAIVWLRALAGCWMCFERATKVGLLPLTIFSPRFRALKNLFGVTKGPDCGKVSGVYELLLRQYSESGACCHHCCS